MKYLSISLLFICALANDILVAQQTVTRPNSPRSYAAGQPLASDKAAALDATFEELNVSMLNVSTQQSADPEEAYLLEGIKIAGDYLDLFPAKYRRWARREGTEVYAGATIRGDGDALYIVRFVEDDSERIELFNLEGEAMRHAKTLAYYDCSRRGCKEVESFITDINQDARLDVARIYRRVDKNGTARKIGQQLFLMDTTGKFKKTNMELDPTLANSIRFE
jgi:hypothetical protein